MIVVWDEEDPSQAPYLQGALMVAVSLVTRKQSNATEADLKALHDLEDRVAKEIERLDRIRKAAIAIQNNAEKIAKEVDASEKQLRRIIENAASTLAALDVETNDPTEQDPIEIQ